ncbi:hypothetical protein NDU88_004139 [Pleurodeles waltl]|uniref:Uncharacterized protein n=1 Tax=Pleurodeles waltl TaxID=8319 RepID=A0AAV7SHZ6_PLEWA|nr:hypothetical protein NDU88_004139 [Pleurodeles waltl]
MPAFYAARADVPEEETKTFVKDCPVRKLNPGEQESLEADFTEAKIAVALAQLHAGKAPGDSGLPLKFYRKIGYRVAKPLLLVY